MSTLIIPLFVLVLWALVYCTDTAVTSVRAGSFIRAVCYGIVALLALLSLLFSFGLFRP